MIVNGQGPRQRRGIDWVLKSLGQADSALQVRKTPKKESLTHSNFEEKVVDLGFCDVSVLDCRSVEMSIPAPAY